jgi:glycosyltransferase involved in cell wall biosynthesis
MEISNKVILYAKYLDTLGGGELQALKLYEVIRELSGKEGIILSPTNITKEQLKNRFDVNLKKTELIQIPNLPTIPKEFHNCSVFINGTDRSLIQGIGKKNILLVFFPIEPHILAIPANIFSKVFETIHKPTKIKLFSLGANYLAAYKSLKHLDSYNTIFSNSQYTQSWIKKYWNKDSEIIYGPANINEFINKEKKQNKIIAVGRFFQGGKLVKSHNKRQDVLINAFKKLVDDNKGNGMIHHVELNLVGSLGTNQRDKEYLQSLKDLAEGYKINFKVGASFSELKALYAQSKVFWHAAGFGVDEEKNPEQLEHFGLTTVEAMAAGCIPVVINKGGQKEIVQEGENGFLWEDEDEFVDKTLNILAGKVKEEELRKNAIKSSKKYSMEVFESKVKEVLSKKK